MLELQLEDSKFSLSSLTISWQSTKLQTLGEHHKPIALRSKTQAGEVFKIKVKLLSCEGKEP